MPDSYGKRQKDTKKAKKFAAREERRAMRKQERADEEAGITRPAALEDGTDAAGEGEETPTIGSDAGTEPAGETPA
jgi:hypothetical protein